MRLYSYNERVAQCSLLDQGPPQPGGSLEQHLAYTLRLQSKSTYPCSVKSMQPSSGLP